jgi:hypothetical protein
MDGATPVFGLVLDIDGTLVRCVAPIRGNPASGLCNDAKVEVSHRELGDCEEMRSGNAVGISCTPNGKFEQRIQIRATPKRVVLQLLDDATIVAERTFDLAYTLNFPNGPDCDPGCRQSSNEWILP